MLWKWVLFAVEGGEVVDFARLPAIVAAKPCECVYIIWDKKPIIFGRLPKDSDAAKLSSAADTIVRGACAISAKYLDSKWSWRPDACPQSQLVLRNTLCIGRIINWIFRVDDFRGIHSRITKRIITAGHLCTNGLWNFFFRGMFCIIGIVWQKLPCTHPFVFPSHHSAAKKIWP